MAVVLVDVETLLGEELKDSFRHAVNILMDELFGINVELSEKLISSALETYLVDRILSLPQRAIEQAYCTLYENISKPLGYSKLTGAQQVTVNNAVPPDVVDSLGFTQQEKNDVFKMASSLMQLSANPVKGQAKQREILCGEIHKNIKNILAKAGKDIITEGKAVEAEADDLYKKVLKPMVKVGKEFVPEGKGIETESADLYKNVLKPMVKVGKEFVPEGKGVETESADLYKNVLKPMVKVGKEFVPDGKGVENEAADLYRNILKPMWCERMSVLENVNLMQFVDFMEDMHQLWKYMRVYETSPMSMKSPESMMMAATA